MERSESVVSDEIVENATTNLSGSNMRRRRRSNGAWLPIAPTYWGDSELGTTTYQSTLTFNSNQDQGDSTIVATPLVLDQTQEIDTTDPGVSMRDLVEGQEYLLQRVVGQVWMAAEQLTPGDPTSPHSIGWLGCIALAVLPVDDIDPQTPGIPAQDWNPFLAQNVMQPWLWRRTWRLSNNLSGIYYQYPPTSSHYGGNANGGFLDTKGTKRRIRKEQRLFLIAGGMVLDITTGEDISQMQFGLDLRVFGGMRRAKNTSTFK